MLLGKRQDLTPLHALHVHANVDRTIVGTRIISNQVGYPGENVSDFNAGKVIEI